MAGRAVISERFCRDAGDDALVEGILARIVESADQSRDLADPGRDGFLCGMEFDNLVTAHGRRGRRGPGELHQLCVGFRSLGLAEQATLLDRVLAAFGPQQG